jgi:hypothetical protein
MLESTRIVRAVKVRVRETALKGDTPRAVERGRVKRVETTTAAPAARLKFGRGNAKLASDVRTFSLPAGWSCPSALACLAKAERQGGGVSDGGDASFRCFAASEEARYPSVRRARWWNLDALPRAGTREGMAALILDSLPGGDALVRVHPSGDFFSQDYFDAWCDVARARPGTTFYAYTKSLPYWVARIGSVPPNLVLTASVGGRHDALIAARGLRSATVVFSDHEAAALGLELDHDDSHAMTPGPSFALLIHGVQPKGTAAARALRALRAQGDYGYGKAADARRARRVPLAVLS